jgi:hypothetical protein
MNRILGIVSAMLLGLLVLVPVVAAAEPWDDVQHLIVSTGGDVTVPAGQHVDLLVVTDGTATIAGTADGVVIVGGSANFTGGQAESVIAVDSTVSLDPSSSVSGDIRTFKSTVDQASGAVVGGQIIDGVVAGLTAAAVATRQVRSAGALIAREPLQTLAAAIVGLIGMILVSILAMITVIGIPVGLVILIVVLPAAAFAGWLVAAIWIGEEIVIRLTPQVTRERPYLAAVIGVIVLTALGFVPFVGGIIGLFGFGAVVLYMWRSFRDRPSIESAAPTEAATAGG